MQDSDNIGPNRDVFVCPGRKASKKLSYFDTRIIIIFHTRRHESSARHEFAYRPPVELAT